MARGEAAGTGGRIAVDTAAATIPGGTEGTRLVSESSSSTRFLGRLAGGRGFDGFGAGHRRGPSASGGGEGRSGIRAAPDLGSHQGSSASGTTTQGYRAAGIHGIRFVPGRPFSPLPQPAGLGRIDLYEAIGVPIPGRMTPFLILLLAYLIGSIPFGYVLVRLKTGQDVRSMGSGNIGATNVLRTTGRAIAVATLVLDIAKGFAAVWIACQLTDEMPGSQAMWASASALAVMAGHSY